MKRQWGMESAIDVPFHRSRGWQEGYQLRATWKYGHCENISIRDMGHINEAERNYLGKGTC